MVGYIDDMGDLRDLLPNHSLDAHSERGRRCRAPLASTPHLDMDGVVAHIDELDEPAMRRNTRIDHLVDYLLNPFGERA